MSAKLIAVGEIEAARRYTLEMVAGIDDAQWFAQPAEGVTHIAWQVGHLAFAEFRLALGRLRGDQPEDERLFSARFIELFGRGSTPQADRSAYPEPSEILDTLDRVHQQALGTIAAFSDVELNEPQIGPPHRIFSTKLDALFWCARHEMLHAGQIGLLKRLQGNAPRW